MASTIHWLDANVFIEAKNGPYAFKLVPQFWILISEQLESGTVACPKMVYDELIDGKDDLAEWLKPRKEKGMCHHSSEPVQNCVNIIADHVVSKFPSHQAAEFLMGADPFLIAHAMNGDGVVVTQESDKSHKAKSKIPTVCKALQVRCINTYQMLKALKADFSG
jgi:hypothetical protein